MKAQLDLLIEAQQLARNHPQDARVRFGLSDELIELLAKAPASRLAEIASAKVLLLTPRSTAALKAALRGDEAWKSLAAAVAQS